MAGCTEPHYPGWPERPPINQTMAPAAPLRTLAIRLILEGKKDRAAGDPLVREDMAWNVPWTTAAAARRLRPQVDTNYTGEQWTSVKKNSVPSATSLSATGGNTRILSIAFAPSLPAARSPCHSTSTPRKSPRGTNGSSMSSESSVLDVERIIRSCATTICLVGDTTYRSEPVNWEIRKSTALGKAVLGVYLQSVTASIPPALSEIGVTPVPWNVTAIKEELHEQPD